MTPQTLGTVGLYASAAISTLAFAGFVTLARFWHSRGGWLVFWDLLIVTWVLDLGTLAHLFDPPWFTWLRIGTFAVGLPLVLGWRCWIIFDLQLRRRWRTVLADTKGKQEEKHAA